MMKKLRLLLIFVSLISFQSFAHSQSINISGKYEGTVTAQPFGKLAIKAEIRQINNKFSGVFNTPLGDAEIIEGSLAEEKLTLKIDAGGDDIILRGNILPEGKISGEIISLAANGTFELKRIGNASPPPDTRIITAQSKEKWREDLQYLASELPKRHKNAFHKITKEDFAKLIADLNAKIEILNDDQIVLEMSRMVAQIGDGHTLIQWSWAYPTIPLQFYWFGKELRVIKSSRAFPRTVGARVVKINGVKIEDLYEKSRPFIPQGESEQFVLEFNAYLMRFPIFLGKLTTPRKNESAKFDFVDASGKTFSLELKAIPSVAQIDWIAPYKNAPLYLQREGEPLTFEYLKDAKTVYVNFKWYPRRAEFAKFSKELFDFVDRNAVEKLVIDLRLNGGGDFTRGRDYFLKPIKERPKFLERGKFFVIAGRRTFSAAMSNTADFRNEAKAFIVGEPTGGRPNSYSELRQFILPNSHLPVWVSVNYYKFAEQDTAGIIPDKLIEPDWTSFLAGRDSALEWILAQPL